ncbi:MAG: anaerobic sulfatase-maturation protein [Prevotella sp.]|nr:anaerobic sulfatase-maturation protein [Prevotella sp.]
MNGNTASPFARQLYVMLKPAGPRCNLACHYCYYLEKEQYYPDQAKAAEMDDELLERFTREYIQAQTTREVLFVWHGGEPLLRPVSFYERALELQRKYASGRHIDNVIQTNGTLIDDDWCRFFKKHNWLVGISIDGPQAWHDAYRRNMGGKPTWERVMQAIEKLKKYDVDFNAMAVVNRLNADHPEEFYRFFKQIGAHYIQFTPVVERKNAQRLLAPEEEGEVTDFSVLPEQWGLFLCRLFDEWVKEDVGEYFIQLFDATLANWCGVRPGVCSMGENCGHAAVMEFNGDVYSCDHFVFPQYRLGNIHTLSLVEMLYGPKQQAFSRIKRERLPHVCRQCRFLFACHGECPKNRFVKTADGEPSLNYLCRGYKQFFSHVKPYMDFMRDEYNAGRPPSNVMHSRIK